MILACDGNHCAAMLLSFMIYWHDIRLSQVEKSRQQNSVAESHGDTPTQDTTLLQFHNERELELGLLGMYKARTITDALHILTEKGFAERHTNPNPRYHFDRTRYFLLKPQQIQNWIETEFTKHTRLEVDNALTLKRDRQKRQTDAAELPNVVNIEPSHRQNCSTVAQNNGVALQNRRLLNVITTCDYYQDSIGDTHVPQTPSEGEYHKAATHLERAIPVIVEKEMVTPVSLPQITESEAVIQEYPPTPHTQGTGTGVGTALHVGVVAAGTGTGVDDEFQLQADFEAGKPASENGKGKVALPHSKKAGRPVSASKNGIPQTDHARLMAAQVEITGQPILNGGALGKAIKTILGAYTVDQAIECLRWMAEPSTNWKGSVNWLAVQNYIGEYFRRQQQQQLKTNGGLNDKDVRGNLSRTKAETKADRSWITRQKWFQERFGDNTKVA